MILFDLITEVSGIIQDDSWDESMIKALLNQALLSIASGVILPGKFQLSAPLPDLYTVSTVDTTVDSSLCSLPDDFNRDLIQVVNANNDDIPINPSVVNFLKCNPKQEAGPVRIVATNGHNLIYRDVPTVPETLTVHYYKIPSKLINTDDEPTCIPVQLHKPLLVGFVCTQIFAQIEDGIEGQKINTAYWNNEFQKGLINLGVILEEDGLPNYYDDLEGRID